MRIGRVFGIDVTVHVSWLFVFALVAYSLASNVGPFGRATLAPGERAFLGVLTAVLFFASVLVHELAHSLVARAAGIPVRGITLFIFGGVSQFGEDPPTAPSAAWTAFVGPLTSIVLAALFYGVEKIVGPATPAGLAFGYLAFANVLLGAFNLLPAYPLDGGRVLHALVWQGTHDRLRATRIAARVGAAIAWIMIALGIEQTLVSGSAGGLWFTFVGWFLLQAGGAESVQAELQNALAGHSARELAESDGTTIPADTTAETALRTLIEKRLRAAPVMVGERLVGLVSIGDFARDPQTSNAERYVTAVMTRIDDVTTVTPQTRAVDVMRVLGRTGFHQVPVIDADGAYLGMVTRESLMRWLAFDREAHVRAAVRR